MDSILDDSFFSEAETVVQDAPLNAWGSPIQPSAGDDQHRIEDGSGSEDEAPSRWKYVGTNFEFHWHIRQMYGDRRKETDIDRALMALEPPSGAGSLPKPPSKQTKSPHHSLSSGSDHEGTTPHSNIWAAAGIVVPELSIPETQKTPSNSDIFGRVPFRC